MLRFPLRPFALALPLLFALGCDSGGGSAPPTDDASVPDDAGATPDTAMPDAAAPPASPPPRHGPSAGCGLAASGAGTLSRTLTVRDAERLYYLAIPEGYDPEEPHALVFAFHGLGDTGQNFSNLGLETVADGEAIVVYPHGESLALGGQRGWAFDEDGDDTAFFDAMLAELEAELCIDLGRVFATGFSYGGYMTNALGCHRGHLLRAIAPVAGGLPTRRGCTGKVAVWLTHGESDPLVTFNLGSAAHTHWFHQSHCGAETSPVDPSPCGAHAGCDEGYPVTWCVHPGGHVFPSYARDAIWSFFDELGPEPDPADPVTD